MYIDKEFKTNVNSSDINFTGIMRSISPDKNPYFELARKIALEENIPERFLYNTKIMAKGNKISFTFRWKEEVESPESKKRKIIAFLDGIPKTKSDSKTILVEINGEIYKDYVYGTKELHNDFLFKDAEYPKNAKEYINSLNIDWNERYKDSLIELFKDYSLNTNEVEDFLKLDYVREFIIAEDGESLTDTAPREVLLEWYSEIS